MRRPPAFLYQVVNRQDSATKLSRLYGATVVLTSDDGATTLYKATIPASTGAQSRYTLHTMTDLKNCHDGKKAMCLHLIQRSIHSTFLLIALFAYCTIFCPR